MPELKSKFLNERGSILVASIAFSIVLAIAGTGMLLLSGNSVRHEAAAFENDRAFLAAESGLLLGKRWLADTTNWIQYRTTGKAVIYAGVINGINDTVSLLPPDVNGDLELRSEATGTDLGFKKRLSWGIRRVINPGIFINDLNPDQKVPGQGGLNNIWFDGPFHSNMPIYLSAVSNPGAKGASVYFVNGKVTVHNKTERIHFASGGHWGQYGSGPSGNNYDWGILIKSGQSEGTSQGDKLDNQFQGTFLHSQDSLFMPRITGQNILLPVNQSPSNRALIYFDTLSGNGIATYYYYNAAGTRLDTTFNINNMVIRAQNAISVLGTVKGQTTLVSNVGHSIYPVGDLKYADFTPVNDSMYLKYNNSLNYGVGTLANGHTNIITLASGGDIHFEKGYKKIFNKATESLVNSPNSNDTMYLTASLIAIEPDRGLMWDTTSTGTIQLSDYNYIFRSIGTRTIDHFFNYVSAGGTNANTSIRFFLDSRILQDFRGPGVPEFRSASSTGVMLFILKTDWREQNIPI
jgi:hypothetical protein